MWLPSLWLSWDGGGKQRGKKKEEKPTWDGSDKTSCFRNQDRRTLNARYRRIMDRWAKKRPIWGHSSFAGNWSSSFSVVDLYSLASVNTCRVVIDMINVKDICPQLSWNINIKYSNFTYSNIRGGKSPKKAFSFSWSDLWPNNWQTSCATNDTEIVNWSSHCGESRKLSRK